MAPPVVCGSFSSVKKAALLGGDEAGKAVMVRVLRDLLEEEGTVVATHNAAYDMACVAATWPELVPIIFAAYDRGEIDCTRVREKLLDIAEGCHKRGRKGYSPYSLDEICKRKGFTEGLDKGEDGWRLRYAELDGIPVHEWPERAREYAQDDAVMCRFLWEDQEQRAAQIRYSMPDRAEQCAVNFALQLAGVWGVHVDQERVAKVEREFKEQLLQVAKKLQKKKLFRLTVGLDGFVDMKASSKSITRLKEMIVEQCEAIGIEVPKTPKGNVVTKKEMLEDLGIPVAKDWGKFSKAEKRLSNYVAALKRSNPLHAWFDILKETGRTSASPSIFQQAPRKGPIRGCIICREGYVFLHCDHDTQEIRTWGQCLAYIVGPENSKLVQRFKADPEFDPHTYMAATSFLNISYEDGLLLKEVGDKELEDARQHAKIANFGLPGGMGVRGLIGYARGFEQHWTPEHAAKVKEAWQQTWPEHEEYFAWVRSIVGSAGVGYLTQFGSGRQRGLVDYCACANSAFQGLAADATKAAHWEVCKRCYTDKSSALYGSRVWNFMHDELMLETPEERGHEAAIELKQIMEETQERYTPDVPARATPVLMRRWIKGAKPRYEDGRLVPVLEAT